MRGSVLISRKSFHPSWHWESMRDTADQSPSRSQLNIERAKTAGQGCLFPAKPRLFSVKLAVKSRARNIWHHAAGHCHYSSPGDRSCFYIMTTHWVNLSLTQRHSCCHPLQWCEAGKHCQACQLPRLSHIRFQDHTVCLRVTPEAGFRQGGRTRQDPFHGQI